MSYPPESRLVPWHNHQEWHHWMAACRDVVQRLHVERGITEDVAMVTTPVALWLCIGPVRLRVSSPNPDVATPEQLHSQVDKWVAFEREAGPGRVLPRDIDAGAARRELLMVARKKWEAAASAVFSDLATINAAAAWWRLHEHDPVSSWSSGRVEDAFGAGSAIFWLSRRSTTITQRPNELIIGSLWIESEMWSRALTLEIEEAQAYLTLADLVQEETAQSLAPGWPSCPVHEHPMVVKSFDGSAFWCCPRDAQVRVAVGLLTPAP